MSTQAPPAVAPAAPPVSAAKAPPAPRTTPAGFAVRGAATALLLLHAAHGVVALVVGVDEEEVGPRLGGERTGRDD